jgi:hypothetical protein
MEGAELEEAVVEGDGESGEDILLEPEKHLASQPKVKRIDILNIKVLNVAFPVTLYSVIIIRKSSLGCSFLEPFLKFRSMWSCSLSLST